MEKSNLFRLTFICLVVVHFFNVIEQCSGGITGWMGILLIKLHHKFTMLPSITINDSYIMVFFLFLLIAMIVVGTFVFIEIEWSRVFALILASFDFFYGLAHLSLGIYFRAYVPGMFTGTTIIMLSFLVIYFDYLQMNPLKNKNESV